MRPRIWMASSEPSTGTAKEVQQVDIIGDGILWQHIISRIESGCAENVGPRFHIWTDGNDILVDDEGVAETIADFLEILGFDTATTGYFDPLEDARSGEEDDHTGWYYISVE